MSEAPAFENLPPRLDLIAPGDLEEAQRALYEAITGGPRASQAGTVPIVDESGRLLGPFAIMLLTPEVGNAMQQVGAKIRFAAALTARERELAILAVAGVLRSDFERLAHEPAALRAGLTQAQVNAVLSGQVPDGLADAESVICRLARVMTAERSLAGEDYEAGIAALGKERLAELTWLVGYYSALALSLAVFRPFIPESFGAAHDRATGELSGLPGDSVTRGRGRSGRQSGRCPPPRARWRARRSRRSPR
ncbi:MAG TPA: carboxymuconolactone decarboxylase family protein [Trebonia sp.]